MPSFVGRGKREGGGDRVGAMGNAIFASQFMANPITLSDAPFVINLYEAFLQRGPEESGLNFWIWQGSDLSWQRDYGAFTVSQSNVE